MDNHPKEDLCLPPTTPPSDDLSNPYGYSEMDWAAQLGPVCRRPRGSPTLERRRGRHAVGVKVKELIVLGVLASRGLQYGVEAHMRRAIEHGATRDELFEAIKAAAVPGGGVAYSVGPGAPGPGAGRGLRAAERAPHAASGVRPPHRPPPPPRRGTTTSQTSPPPPPTRRRGTAATR